jgi:ketosteroid isomerase-like protein
MRTLVALSIGLLMGALATVGVIRAQTLVADRETREAVTAVKRAIVEGHKAKDAAALARLYADDYTAIDARGTVRTKSALLAALPTDPRLVEGRYDLIAVRRWGTIAVATGRGHLVSALADGSRRTSDYYSFNVFELRDGRWWYVAAFLP